MEKPGKLYLHVFNWPADGTLTVPGYTDHVTRAYLMANPKTDLTMKTNAGGLLIQRGVIAKSVVAGGRNFHALTQYSAWPIDLVSRRQRHG